MNFQVEVGGSGQPLKATFLVRKLGEESTDAYNDLWGEILNSLVEAECRHGEHSIELDCPPGSPRPGDLIAQVIAGTGLPLREDCMRCFGNWKWSYDDVSCEEWDRIQPIIKERITALYNSGRIRYGSW